MLMVIWTCFITARKRTKVAFVYQIHLMIIVMMIVMMADMEFVQKFTPPDFQA